MKKFAFLFFLFFLFSPNVLAKDLKLNELVIENGKLSIPFDPLNNLYTVALEKDCTTLEISYQVDEEVSVSVKDNQDLKNNSIVTVTLTDENKSVDYHFHILKEEEEVVKPTFLETPSELLKTNIMFEYKNYIIPMVCFTLISIVFKILFPKKRKNKK